MLNYVLMKIIINRHNYPSVSVNNLKMYKLSSCIVLNCALCGVEK